MVHVAKLKVVQDSYVRCCAAPDFFQTFYRLLLDSSPVIPVMFGDTDFERQEKLVKHGIALLLLYAKRGNPALLERIAIRHGRKDMNVDPSLYLLFVDSLIAAVKQHDREYTADAGAAWRAVVAPGIKFIMDKY